MSQRLAALHHDREATRRSTLRRFEVDLRPRTLLVDELPAPIPGKLQEFESLPVHDAISRLEKLAKRKFTIGQRAEWDEYLTKETTTLSALKRQIDSALRELNERVFHLFGISAEEGKFIEESLRI